MTKRLKITCYCGAPISVQDYEDGNEEFTYREINAECQMCYNNGGDYSKSPYYTDPCMEAKKREKEHLTPPMPTDITPLKGKRVIPARRQ